ncbi:hypothetical protein HUT18_14320 [Streptomyces sp. NA04227]|uniref:hypothetical protein n=1 Tax=Streptomyces sp. NA04227 TaxID=2742136 RepID=UPI00158FDC4B|nr:hypothetical protein [Streptomyces sp. NA04227]QKW07385.1 hypothetical protein HUT18_14320 [Streptomyces sp. NA04227]
MKLAIGDVVRDRSDRMLCTVAGVTANANGVCVALVASGGGVRVAFPGDIDLVARRSTPVTLLRSLMAVVFLVFASFAGACGVIAAQDLGADWPLMFVTGLGSFSAVSLAYQLSLRLVGPRRFHV